MDLDDFADYKISRDDRSIDHLYLRHTNCLQRWVEKIELLPPLSETNLKWLMLRATEHWQESHRSDSGSVCPSD